MSGTITWKIGGPAGLGIMSMGPLFAKILKKTGYFVHGYPEYPSLIRGGYNVYQAAFSTEPVYAPYRKTDIYVALSEVCFEKEDLDGATIITDFDNLKIKDNPMDATFINVPMKEIVKELEGPDVMKNSVAMGAVMKYLDLDFDMLAEEFRGLYKKDVADLNILAAQKGYDSVSSICSYLPAQKAEGTNGYYLSGNESCGAGAIKAGINFFSTYPMTPASSILHFLAKHAVDYGIVVKHAEDEIAGVNMCVGASFAGARAMTGTSGGGFALMNEGLGLAAITECPMVFAVSQRPGPATGMPTWQEQSDIKYIMSSSQGEFVRAVLTPGDVTEVFQQTAEAFNIAERYQIPVFVVLDKFLSESHFLTDALENGEEIDRGSIFEGDTENPNAYFDRYSYTEHINGVCPRTIPGTPGGLYIAGSNEHDEKGFVTDGAENRIKQTERRYLKLPELTKDMPEPILYGKEKSDVTFVCFGSMKLVLLEAMKLSDKFNFIHFPALYPINWEKAKELFKGCNLVLAENNYTAQLGSIITEHTGIMIEKKMLKYDGRPFFAEEIAEYLQGGK